MRISIHRRRILALLYGAVALMAVLGSVAQLAVPYAGSPATRHFVDVFRLDYEWNLPTWFSSMCLLLAGLLLCAIAVVEHGAGRRFVFR